MNKKKVNIQGVDLRDRVIRLDWTCTQETFDLQHMGTEFYTT